MAGKKTPGRIDIEIKIETKAENKEPAGKSVKYVIPIRRGWVDYT